MQKYLELLERHVQWVAVGIGGLFVLWMAWTYVLQAPAAVTVLVGGVPMAPGQIDELTVEGPVIKLEAAMKENSVPDMTVEDFSRKWKDEMAFAGKPPMLLQNPWVHGGVAPDIGPVGPDLPGHVPGPQLAQLTALPKLAPPIYLANSVGRSTVNVAPPNPPGVNLMAAPAPAGGQIMDIDWVSLSFKISTADLIKAYQAVQMPLGLYPQSLVLRVDLVREELVEGKWINPTPIAPLANLTLKAYPGDNAPGPAATDYEDWAKKNQADLLQPNFYPVFKGDKWYAPGQPNVNNVAPPPTAIENVPPPTPKPPTKQPPRKVGPKSERPQPAADDPDPRAPIFPRRYLANDPQRPVELAQAFPDNQPGFFEAPPQAGMVAAPGIVLPPGAFDPTKLGGDIEVRCHDPLVNAGHTYRYKLCYRMQNPAFQVARACKNPKDADVFGIVSEFSAPSPAISIQSRVNFFVFRGINFGDNKVKFEIFKWKDGQLQSKIVDAGVGDMIGADNMADFSTGWTVIDFRPDPRDVNQRVVLLMDENGHMERRDFDSDKDNPLYKDLRKQAAPKAAAAAMAADGR